MGQMRKGSFCAELVAVGMAVGMSAAAHAQRADPQPIGDAATWISSDDYPPEAIRAKQQGKVVVLVAINATGTATGCTVETSSNVASLDAKTCELMKHPSHRFYPARDDKGKAVEGIFKRKVLWTLPADDDTMGPVETSGATFRMIVDAEGVTTGCQATVLPAGHAIDSGRFCAKMGASVRQAVLEHDGKERQASHGRSDVVGQAGWKRCSTDARNSR